MKLQIFATNFTMEGKNTSIKYILKYLRNTSSTQRTLLSGICVIVKLIVVMPITKVKDCSVLYGGQDILVIYNETNWFKSFDDSSCP